MTEFCQRFVRRDSTMAYYIWMTLIALVKLVGRAGFEPATNWLKASAADLWFYQSHQSVMSGYGKCEWSSIARLSPLCVRDLQNVLSGCADRKAVVAAITLSIVPCQAFAVEFFTHIGTMKMQAPEDGTYWQSRHEADLDMDNPYLRAGFAVDVMPRTKFTVSGFYLGQWAIDATTTQLDKPSRTEGYSDMNRRHNPKSANGCFGECAPLNKWHVSDTISGIAFTGKVMLFRPLNLELELGKTYNYHRFDMKVTDNHGMPFDGYQANGQRDVTLGSMYGITIGTARVAAGVAFYKFPGNIKDKDFVNDGGQMPIGVRSGAAGFISYKW